MTDNNLHTSPQPLKGSKTSFPPSELPAEALAKEGWVETTLGEVVEFQRGFDLPTNDRIDGIYPLIVSNGIDGYVKDYKVKGPGVVTGRSGTLGKVLFIKENFWPLNTTLWIKDFKNNDEKFIYYWLLNFPFEKYNAGSGVPTLNRNHIHQVDVFLPSNPDEQQAIASVLSAFDDKIELLREQNKTLEEMGQVIFGEWFGKYGVDDELPEGWRVFELSELFSFVKGKKPIETSEIEQDEFIPQILIDTFNGGKTIFANPKNTVISNEDDLIMVMDGASSGRIEFGFSGIIGSTLALLKIEKPIKSILYYFLKSKEKDIQEKTTGSAIPHTDKNKVYNYEIALPNDEVEMQKLDTVFSDFREKIIANRFQIQTLARSRDELLPRLMRGEVRVGF